MKFIHIFLLFFIFTTDTLARSCNSDEKDKGEYFSEKAGMRIISKYGGGQNKRVKVSDCEFNSYSNEFKIKIEIYWNGAIFSDSSYNVDGILKLRLDGSQVNFVQTLALSRWKNSHHIQAKN